MSDEGLRILIVEDEPADVVLIHHELRRANLEFRCKRVDTRDEFLCQLANHPPDLILSDHGLPHFDGFTALQLAKDRCPDVPFIFVTGSLGEQVAIETLKRGATDYVLKDRLSTNLVPAVRQALRQADERRKRKQAEQALRESEQRFHISEVRRSAILETALDAILLIDSEGIILEWNPAAHRIFGYSHDEVVGKSIDQTIIPPGLRAAYHDKLSDYLITGVGSLLGRPIEMHAMRKDGSEFPIELSITRVPDPAAGHSENSWSWETDRVAKDHPNKQESEEATIYSIFVRDVTVRKQAEEELRQSEERYRMLIDGVQDYAIYLLDADGKIATWNTGAERIEGYQADEVIGQHMSKMFPAEDIANGRPDQCLKKAISEGRCLDEGWRVRKDGSRYWATVVYTRLNDSMGKITGFTKIARDITKLKQAEEEILQLNTELEARVVQRTAQLRAAYDEMESFSYSISHDLRAPLRHINGFVDMLQKSITAKLPDGDRELLRTISNSASRMGRLIDDLLGFSKMSRSQMQNRKVNLAELVQEVREDLQRDLDGRTVEWTIGELPTVQGDEPMLRQVFVNLMSNALKYTRNQAVGKIEITCTSFGEEFVICVHDNGVGFDMKYAGKLFGVFQRLHGTSQFEGTGIGLANARRIIQRHSGRVWAESSPGKGASFYFSLPKKPKPQSHANVPPPF